MTDSRDTGAKKPDIDKNETKQDLSEKIRQAHETHPTIFSPKENTRTLSHSTKSTTKPKKAGKG